MGAIVDLKQMTAITPDLIAVKDLDGYKLDLVFADALQGVIRLPDDFDEREYKSKRLANRFGVLGLTQKGGAHVCLDG